MDAPALPMKNVVVACFNDSLTVLTRACRVATIGENHLNAEHRIMEILLLLVLVMIEGNYSE